LRSDLRPDLTLGRAELALKVCHATGRLPVADGGKKHRSTRKRRTCMIRCWQTGLHRNPIRQCCSVFKDHCALRRGREG
jgi:hypothetical protein